MNEKNERLTDIQLDVDTLAQSVADFSEQNQQDYLSINGGNMSYN